MMIVNNEKIEVSFEELYAGNVFRRLDSEDIFLKIDTTDTNGEFNCVNLSHNKLCHVGSSICVERVPNAKLILE